MSVYIEVVSAGIGLAIFNDDYSGRYGYNRQRDGS